MMVWFMMVWFISTCIVMSSMIFWKLLEYATEEIVEVSFKRTDYVQCFKILERKVSLQPHFNCIHDRRTAFSTTKRQFRANEDLSSPTEDQIQCDPYDNDTPSASVESPPFLPASSPLFRQSSSMLQSLNGNTSSPKFQSPTFSPPFQQKSMHTPTPESTNKIMEHV